MGLIWIRGAWALLCWKVNFRIKMPKVKCSYEGTLFLGMSINVTYCLWLNGIANQE